MRPGHAPTPYSIVTPSRRHSVSWLRIMSPNSARFGTDAASRTCPPAWLLLLVHGHLAATACGGDRRLQPARPGADDHDRPT